MKTKHLLSLLLLILPFTASAYDFYKDGIYYNINTNKTSVSVTYNYQDLYSGKITIPSIVIYNNTTYSVTNIGFSAFKKCTYLTSVTIPNSVTSIDGSAFLNCIGLTSITIPESVTNIGSSAFEGCTGLTSITIPNSVANIGSSAFSNCRALASITIPESMTSINSSTFKTCTSLTSITIPNSITKIEDSAFLNCTNLISATFGNNVTSVEDRAFNGCRNLNAIYITDIAAWCNIDFESYNANPLYNARNLYLNDELVTDLVIPETVTEIKDYSFYNCSGLASATFGNSVTNIGKFAFCSCTELSTITLGNNVTYIENSAFKNCTSLTSVIIPNSVTHIENYAFDNCTSLASVSISDSIINIGRDAFRDTPWYNNFPDGIIYFDSLLYEYRGEMPAGTNITIKEGTKTINLGAFSGYKNLASITIPESVTNIGESVFENCTGLTTVNFNAANCTKMGDFLFPVFEGCANLTIINIGENVETIPHFAFYNCTGLKTISIPNGVTSIGGSAFSGCTGLTTITIPEGVTSIGSEALPPQLMTVSGISPSATNCTITLKSGISGVKSGMFFDSVFFPIEEANAIKIKGLIPETNYTVTYGITLSNGKFYQLGTTEIRTIAAVLTTLPAQATSDTRALLCAETNLDDETTGTGFEWRRYDAPDAVSSTLEECPIIDGKLTGTLCNLSSNTYYKFRPYYTTPSGTTYNGEWQTFGTADAYVYFEPTVRTDTVTEITDNSACVSGYAVSGSDEIIEQGFEYWITGTAPTEARMRKVANEPVKKSVVLATGLRMTATLTDLLSGTIYSYRTFVTTTVGTTYGEEQSFTTTGVASLCDNHIDAPTEVARYTIEGIRLAKPTHGINIVCYSDGSVRKVIVP